MNAYDYYSDSNNWGDAQFVTLKDVVDNFMIMYVGNDKLIDNVSRYNILFHAKRGIQELNYDAMRNIKVLEINVGDDLKFILPQDYVNYVRISLYKNGALFKLTEASNINYATAYLQDNNNQILFDQDGNVLEGMSQIDIDRITGVEQQQCFLPGWCYGQWGWCYDNFWYFRYGFGGRFGLETSEANGNPKFVINKAAGVINFSSGSQNNLFILEYISDGLENADPSEVKIHKFAEEFIYSYIKWCMLNNRAGIPEYIITRSRTEKAAMLRNAKLRLSNMHAGRLLMPMRGKDKWIK